MLPLARAILNILQTRSLRNTLYHHLKFPINKAFYLTYIDFAGIRYTHDQLSEILDLRKPTIWAFRNKISKRLKQKEYSQIKNWQDMVVDKNKSFEL